MATKRQQSSTGIRRSGKGNKKTSSNIRKFEALIILVVIALVGVIGIYLLKRPVSATAMGCTSGYSAPDVPKDSKWNSDTSLVVTRSLGDPTYDQASRTCTWHEKVTVSGQGNVERKECNIYADEQKVACPKNGQTITVFSGTRTGDPDQQPYFPAEFTFDEVLGDGATYIINSFKY